jgi:YVTN family beta-propeller protein
VTVTNQLEPKDPTDPQASWFESFLMTTTSLLVLFLIACSTAPIPGEKSKRPSQHQANSTSVEVPSPEKLPLRVLTDVPLSDGPTRFDYQSIDAANGRLYIAHLGSDLLTAFDLNKQTIIGDVKDLKHVHGVIAVPELHRVYASATGTNELAVIDDQSLRVITRVPAGNYPDGIAFAKKENKIYVSDLHGKTDTVIDAGTNQRVATVQLGGGAGNTQYDDVSDRIFVAVDGREELAEIDPNSDRVVTRYPLMSCKGSHGLFIDSEHQLAFVACEENGRLVVFDLETKKVMTTLTVGDDPDVLAFDASLGRLYVSAESGIVAILDEHGRNLEKVGEGFFAPNAHTVAVDSRTHRVYFPLQNVNGKPVLRIAVPTDKQL